MYTDGLLFLLLAPAAAFILPCVQVTMVRLPTKPGYVWGWLYGFSTGLALLLLVQVALLATAPARDLPQGFALSLANVMIYMALAYIYMSFTNSGMSSLRVRMLQEIAAEEGIPEPELLKRYNVETMGRMRLERLDRSGQVRREGDRYVLTKRSILIFSQYENVIRFALLGEGSVDQRDLPAIPIHSVFTRQFIVFLLVGALNTLFGFSVYSLFIFLGAHYALASLLSALICPFFNFMTTGRLVFGNRDVRLIGRFIVLSAVIYVCNVSIIRALTFFTDSLYLAGFGAAAIMAVVTFICQKVFVFRKPAVCTTPGV